MIFKKFFFSTLGGTVISGILGIVLAYSGFGVWALVFQYLTNTIIDMDGLPKSDVLKFLLEDNCSLVVRPSGTEPKLKIYISVSAENKEMAEKVEDEIAKTAEKWIC